MRTIEVEGKPYFVANDVAKALGYVETAKAVRTHCKGVSETDIPTNGGVQKVKIIPEGDIYRLIVKSQLPSAERFESWVFDEVIPSIRKHGGYIAGQETLSDHVDEDDKGVTKCDTPTYTKGCEYYSYAYIWRKMAIFVCK